MAEIKTLIINVKDKEVDALNTKLLTTGENITVIERDSGKVEKGFKKIGKSSIVFEQLNKWTGGLAGNLVDVYNGLGKVNLGLTATKTALIATGIGAFVVILGTIVAYWDDIVEFITKANEKLQEQIDLFKAKESLLSAEYKVLDEQQKLLELQGKSTDDLIEKKKLLLQSQLGILGAELALLQTQNERIRNQAKELTFWEKVGDILARSTRAGAGRRASTEGAVTAEEQIAIAQGQEAEAALRERIFELQATLEGLINPQAKKGKADKRGREQKVNPLTGAEYDAEIERLVEFFDTTFELDKANKDALQESAEAANAEFLNSQEVRNAKQLKIDEQSAEARKRLSDEEFALKQRNLFAYADAAQAVGALLGQETAAGKALSVAASLINTYAAIAGQLRIFSGPGAPPIPGYAIAQAIATAAVGFKAVKDILAVDVPGGGTSSSPAGPVAPSFNIVAGSGQNQLNQALIERDQQPVQAFITEGEIGSKEELRRKKLAASSF